MKPAITYIETGLTGQYRFQVTGMVKTFCACTACTNDSTKALCVCAGRSGRYPKGSGLVRLVPDDHWVYKFITQHIGELYDPLACEASGCDDNPCWQWPLPFSTS